MQFWDLFQWWNLIFALPFGVGLLPLLLQALGASHFHHSGHVPGHHLPHPGHADLPAHHAVPASHTPPTADTHAPAHVDAQGTPSRALTLLGIGKVPVMLVFSIFCLIWGATGVAANQIFAHVLPGPALYVWLSALCAFLVAYFMTGSLSQWISRLMPDLETYGTATSLGGRSGQDEAIMRLVGDKLVSGLRTVAGRSNLDHLHRQVDEYSAEVKKIVEEDLAHNGLFLESVTVTYLNQTPLEKLNPESNVFDALGAQKIAEVTNKSRVAISQAKATADQQVKAQEVERDQRVFELNVTQKNAQAESERKAAEYAAEQSRLSKLAQVTAEQAVAVAEVDKQKAVEVASALQQQAVQAAQIEKDKAVEIAQRKKQSEIANAETQRTAAETARIQAETEREKANQSMLTVQKESEAERQKRISIIQKQAVAEQTKIERNMQADVSAYATVKSAEADKLAAEDEASAKLRLADADKAAKTLQAEGDQAVAMIPVNVAAEQVKVDQSRVEVLKLELETKSANQRLSFELEVQKAKIAAERDVRIALASAMGQAFSSSEFKIYGDPATAARMLAMFTSGQEYAQVIDGFVRQAPSEVTDLAVNSIGKFSEAAAGLVKKLFDKDVPPDVIAQAVETHLKEAATKTNSTAAATAGGGGNSSKGR